MVVFQETKNYVDRPSSTYDLVWQMAEIAVNRVQRRVRSGYKAAHDFAHAHEALARLPIAQNEFALATLRLDNAEVYFGRGETGAAKFELNLLSGMIYREAGCLKIRQTMKSRC